MGRYVTRDEFAAIECNRCGAYCTRFHLASDPRVALQRELALGACPESDAHVRDLATIAAMSEKVADAADGGAWYRCRHFRWEEDGLGACTIHERRPEMCRGFPYDKPVPDVPTCSWNVRLVRRRLPVVP